MHILTQGGIGLPGDVGASSNLPLFSSLIHELHAPLWGHELGRTHLQVSRSTSPRPIPAPFVAKLSALTLRVC